MKITEKSIPEVLYLKDERMVLRGFRKPGTRLQPDREGTAGEPGRGAQRGQRQSREEGSDGSS